MISDIWIVKELSVHLIHYVRLDGFDLYRFEKKLLFATSFAAVALKKLTNWILKILVGPAQSSIVPLKKRTVKQILSALSC